MGRPRKVVYAAPTEPPVRFDREYKATLPSGREIISGEIIKITGEYGATFKFESLTTNTKTGVSWIDCKEIHKGQVGQFRAFYIDRVKKQPVRRKKRKKNVD
jgi:hypothetical protein